MSAEARADRGRRAELAMDEFLTPVIDAIRADYHARLKQLCANEPWSTQKIASLANAARVVDEIEKQLRILVLDGMEAMTAIDRQKKIEQLSPQRRKWLGL